jgi:putative flavoprotein involved in K+ transport
MTVTTPSQRATRWLADFGAALAAGQAQQAAAKFDADSYWRDLIAFTWNIRTQEGPAAIAEMLTARLADAAPSNFALEGEATEADGVVDAWFTFETRVARGRGHLRLKDDKAWTFLTTMTELKGFEVCTTRMSSAPPPTTAPKIAAPSAHVCDEALTLIGRPVMFA